MYSEDEHEHLSGIGMPGATSSQIELNEDHLIHQTSSDYLDDMDEEEGEGEKPFSYFDFLDRPRILPEPCDLTLEHLKQISYELGLIKLCWPEIIHPTFEDRTNFPESYLKNSDKEKLLLLYTENFRQQFCHRHPHRKPLFLACENECGMQKMVCTTIRPTTLPYSELQSWEDLTKFVGDHLKYEPLEEPTLIVMFDLFGDGGGEMTGGSKTNRPRGPAAVSRLDKVFSLPTKYFSCGSFVLRPTPTPMEQFDTPLPLCKFHGILTNRSKHRQMEGLADHMDRSPLANSGSSNV